MKSRTEIGTIRGVKIYFLNYELLMALVLLGGFSNTFAERLGKFCAFFLLVSVHEIGHALFGAICGWRTQAITVGIWGGLCEFHEDGPDVDDAAHDRQDTFVSWGGVVPEIIILLVAVSLSASGVWPGGSFFEGVQFAFTWMNALMIAANLLPIQGHDGETAWRFLRTKPR